MSTKWNQLDGWGSSSKKTKPSIKATWASTIDVMAEDDLIGVKFKTKAIGVIEGHRVLADKDELNRIETAESLAAQGRLDCSEWLGVKELISLIKDEQEPWLKG